MKHVLALSVVAGLACAGAALAADLPNRSPAAPAPVAPAFTWTGFYVGANAGYGWSESRTRYDYVIANPAELPEFHALGLVPGRLGRNGEGFIGGGQVGYNYQIGQFVVGVEADIQYLDARQRSAHVTTISDEFGAGAVATTAQSSIDWLGTLRARAGYAFDRTLVYATGGLAYGHAKDSTAIAAAAVDQDGPMFGLWSGRRSRTSVGWTLGAGVEYAVTDNLTLKAEYLYYDLGRSRYGVAGVVSDPDDEFRGANARRDTSGSIVRAGLNWKFSAF